MAGSALGKMDDGESAGDAIGSTAGWAAGSAAGSAAGAAVGGDAGAALGTAVGGPIGGVVGEEVGSWAGKEAGSYVGGELGSELGGDVELAVEVERRLRGRHRTRMARTVRSVVSQTIPKAEHDRARTHRALHRRTTAGRDPGKHADRKRIAVQQDPGQADPVPREGHGKTSPQETQLWAPLA